MFHMGCKKGVGSENKTGKCGHAISGAIEDHFHDSGVSMDSDVQNDQELQNLKQDIRQGNLMLKLDS